MVQDLFRFRGRARRRQGDEAAPGAILTERQHELVAQELAILERLSHLLAAFPATPEDQESIAQAAEHLTALFMLVIVGEFNAGKSAFINALIGADVMPEGVTPTTSVINLLQYGPEVTEGMQPDGVIVRTFPADFLDEITIVDTPGTNAIIREHETLTQRFVPRADIVLFVTSADRPFTESERAFMESIRDWGKKIVVIINKIDLLRDEASLAQVTTFVQDNIQRLLGFTPDVFPVSSLLAQQAKALGDRNPEERARLWEASRFGPLETYIVETLDEEGRIRLKLLNPLGVGELVTERYLAATQERLTVLRDDIAAIDNIEAQLAAYQTDMRAQFTYHLTRIENVIARMVSRGDAFFDETIRLGRVFDLLNSDKIRGMFEREVVGDAEAEIDQAIDELIDWMVEQDLKTWKAVTDYIDRRRLAKYEEGLIGQVGAEFRYDRKNLIESVTKRARQEVDRYDPQAEAHELSQGVRTAVATVAVAEAGAVGLGALVVAAASTAAVDITGILAASIIAGIGLFVLPAKRRQARRDFHDRASELETRLVAVMREQFEHELARSVDRIRDAIAPYTRFVRTQYDRFTQMEGDFVTVGNDLRALRHRIGDDGRSRQAYEALPSYARYALGGATGPTGGNGATADPRPEPPGNGRPNGD
jgi:small GTP-binding protein